MQLPGLLYRIYRGATDEATKPAVHEKTPLATPIAIPVSVPIAKGHEPLAEPREALFEFWCAFWASLFQTRDFRLVTSQFSQNQREENRSRRRLGAVISEI